MPAEVEDERDERDERLRGAKRRLASDPGLREFRRLDAFGRTLAEVFRPNHMELLRLLEAGSKNVELATCP